ncbi:MAG: hypothetical protein NZ869_06930 [Thermoanaerobaculum sp.]|nr:hypothetical protein [Thermoanaerobaculum sp.]MDW7966638.1 hypothetical protein [Thermoanaerobaculum sp.]
MSTATFAELNQRYIKLADRCRAQWTFYQLLQGLAKHLAHDPPPPEVDFRETFERLKEVADNLNNPDTAQVQRLMDKVELHAELSDERLRAADQRISPSLLRRFFDRLSTRDEKVLLAVIKFYLDAPELDADVLDKLDVLFTRLAEIPRAEGGFLSRERHELERLTKPLLAGRPLPQIPQREVEILLEAILELRSDIMAKRTFSELMASGGLDRFRNLKRRLGPSLLHPQLLPALMESTVAIKNRFRTLWEEEEALILDDTNRVMELARQLERNPDLLTAEQREAIETFSRTRQRFEQARREDNLRTEDIQALRQSLTTVLEQFDAQQGAAPKPTPTLQEAEELGAPVPVTPSTPAESTPSAGDPLLHEYVNKIMFALELAGKDRPPAELVQAREVVALRLEPWEVEACLALGSGAVVQGTLAGERSKLFALAAALRLKADEEAREIDRLSKRSSERLAELLEQATQTLQRAAELDRRFTWLIEDALYRGDTEHLEKLYRSRFRLLRAYSGLWLIHHDRGGISPF